MRDTMGKTIEQGHLAAGSLARGPIASSTQVLLYPLMLTDGLGMTVARFERNLTPMCLRINDSVRNPPELAWLPFRISSYFSPIQVQDNLSRY